MQKTWHVNSVKIINNGTLINKKFELELNASCVLQAFEVQEHTFTNSELGVPPPKKI